MRGPPRKGPSELVYGVHPVLELLESRGAEVDRLFVAQERHGGLGRILRLAREAGVPVSHLPRQVLARKLGPASLHQGIAARVAPRAYVEVDTICERAMAGKGLLVVLDGVVDPRNLGAILRTCAAAAVDGVILAGEGTAGLGPTVAKVSAGAIEKIDVGREAHPGRRLEALRGAGFQALALDPRGSTLWDKLDFRKRTVLVAGGEERGLSTAVARACDARVAIALAPAIDSLNVSVALGVLLFEAVRQRRAVIGP